MIHYFGFNLDEKIFYHLLISVKDEAIIISGAYEDCYDAMCICIHMYYGKHIKWLHGFQ